MNLESWRIGFFFFFFFLSFGMLFQTNAPEYDKLFLNKLILGLGIKTFLLLTERKFEVELLLESFILNNSVRYAGAILFEILYIIILWLSVKIHSQKMTTF